MLESTGAWVPSLGQQTEQQEIGLRAQAVEVINLERERTERAPLETLSHD